MLVVGIAAALDRAWDRGGWIFQIGGRMESGDASALLMVGCYCLFQMVGTAMCNRVCCYGWAMDRSWPSSSGHGRGRRSGEMGFWSLDRADAGWIERIGRWEMRTGGHRTLLARWVEERQMGWLSLLVGENGLAGAIRRARGASSPTESSEGRSLAVGSRFDG
ncbi:hypothetical protein ACLOJK_038823 [Asimina triloba]